MRRIRRFEGPRYRVVIRRRHAAQRPAMRQPPQRHQMIGPQRPLHLVALHQHRQGPRQPVVTELSCRQAVITYRSRIRHLQRGQHAQQRGLAGTVRPDQPDQLARP
ncbi:hypothetical protein QFZ27_004602 [Inquilinus ginsengisoli]